MIFIEGFTDRLYLKKYFDLYQKDKVNKGHREFVEDYHYSFFEYHGSNIETSFILKEDEHFSKNVLRLKESIFVLMDGDYTGSSTATKLNEVLGDQFGLLSCKAIENLVSKRILLKYLKEVKGYGDNDLNNFEESDYQILGCNIIKFIKENIIKDTARNFQAGKNNFCYDIVNLLDDINDLSELTKNYCEEIYNFIKIQNNN